jgi:chromosome segregation ATPase
VAGAPSSSAVAADAAAAAEIAPADEVAIEPPRPAPRALTPAERQVQELEAQLAERDRTIATVQTQLANARRPPAAAAPPGGAPAGGGTSNRAADAGSAAAIAAPSAAAALAAKDAELNEARGQITALEAKLETEVQRRKQIEGEMAKVLEETSSGPFERSSNVVDQHLRAQLASAQKEIGELRTTLATERRQRGELERRFAALQQQLERSGSSDDDSDEIAALKERQRRVLASIQQDLQATQQRERELRATLAQQDSDGVSMADNVTSLRAENAALQQRLDDEHRQNRELASKLKLAGRVTDLIFKMQSSGSTTATAVQQ